MNWAELAKTHPLAWEAWHESGEDLGVFTKHHGIMAYLFDPSLVALEGGYNAWMWEIKYLSRDWKVVSLTDLVQTSESKAFSSMIHAIFDTIEKNKSITMEDYEKHDKEFKPEDWEKAKEDVEGLMNLYTKKVVTRHKRKKFWKTKASRAGK